MSKTVELWVTKYALTRGVERVRCEIKGEYAYSSTRYHVQYPPGHWYTSEAGAIARAEEMKAKKIASLEKQIAKLRKMRFAP